jgi:tetratricopeptide (TPR) repeat protein
MGRYLTANYLAERGWHDEARAEYLRVAQQQDDFLGLSSMLRLAEMEANIGNDRGAIHALEIAHRILTKPQNQRQFMYPESELRAKLEWHHFRLALAAGEPVKADEHLKRLIQFAPKDGAIAMDLNARLKALGKEKEAATLFDFAYQAALARLAEPDEVDEEGRPDPSEMLNNLAWLCARSGEKLDEALRHAQRAVERHPANGAFLDTLAEVYFVRGDNERAARLERLALIFRPGDRFMLGQLQRFESNAR